MAFLVSLKGINAAIDALSLKEGTLKHRLIACLQSYFPTDEALRNIASIPTEQLVRALWETDDASEIKAKRKNFSSLKSSINNVLRELADKGENPEGLIIGKENVFEVSADRKDSLLRRIGITAEGDQSLLSQFAQFRGEFSDVAREKGWNDLGDLLRELEGSRNRIQTLSDALNEARQAVSRLAAQIENGKGPLAGESELQPGGKEPDRDVEESPGIGGGVFSDMEENRGGGEGDGVVQADLPGNGAGIDGDVSEQFQATDSEDQPEDFDYDDIQIVEVDEEETADPARHPESEEEILEEDSADDLVELGYDDIEETAEAGEDFIDLAAETESGGDIQEERLETEIESFDEEGEIAETDEVFVLAESQGEEGGLAENGTGDGGFTETGEDWGGEEEVEGGEGGGVVVTDLSGAYAGVDVPVAEQFQAMEEGALEGSGELDDAEIVEVDEEEIAYLEEELESGEEILEEGALEGSEEPDDAEIVAFDEEEIVELDERKSAGSLLSQDLEATQGAQSQEDVATGSSPGTGSLPGGRGKFSVLSKYLEPGEAFQDDGETLAENEDDYIRQILNRFTHKFFKIPDDIYTIGNIRPSGMERPRIRMRIPGFYMGEFPVTNDLFELFVRDTGYETDAEKYGYGVVVGGRFVHGKDPATGRRTFTLSRGVNSRQVDGANWRHPEGPGSSIENRHDHPVVQVSYNDALAFAAWGGKRLPTEEEWEAAARGREGFLFPWGNMWLRDRCNLESSLAGSTTPVGKFGGEAASPFAIKDLLGNVYEWTATIVGAGRSGGADAIHVLKGGAWPSSGTITAFHRRLEKGGHWSNIIGFRCAASMVPPRAS